MILVAVKPMNGNFRLHKPAIAASCRAVYRPNDLIPMHEAMPEEARDFDGLVSPGGSDAITDNLLTDNLLAHVCRET